MTKLEVGDKVEIVLNSEMRQIENEQLIADLDKLGVCVYNNDGRFRSMVDIINDIANISNNVRIDTTRLVSGVVDAMIRTLDSPVTLMHYGNMLEISTIDFRGFSQGCMKFIGIEHSKKHGNREFSMNVVYEQPEMSKIQYNNRKGE